MDDYLAKPLDAARLYQMIARYVRDDRPGGEDGRSAAGGGAPGGGTELLDVKDLLERMGGDDELVAEVLRMFLDECGKARDALEVALASGDAKSVRSAAHYFKSMSMNVSARALGEACHDVERLGAAGDLTGAAARLAALGELTRRTSAAISDHLGKP
jgi:HPt (histidine-containing phosphotransfer) domain-containing protein